MPVTIRRLVTIAYEVNAAMASGRCDDINTEAAFRLANDERLFTVLRDRLGAGTELAAFTDAEGAELDEEWARIANCILLQDYKLDGESRGLALVMGLILEGINGRELERTQKGGA
jgi:hypothetical protein